jgi:hypothetical protein
MVYHIHLGKFGFCHSVRHDGESATGLREVILLPTNDCAQRMHTCRARSLIVIGRGGDRDRVSHTPNILKTR